jgi:hypothetical protein
LKAKNADRPRTILFIIQPPSSGSRYNLTLQEKEITLRPEFILEQLPERV